MKFAAIADIHSNHLALAAVLADIERQKISRIVHLGDAMNGPIDPCAVAEILRQRDMIHVSGNGERMVLVDEQKVARSALFARARLSARDLAFAASWPALYRGEDWLACHGSPSSDIEYLLEEVTPTGVFLRKPEMILSSLGQGCGSLVLCGHTHVQRVVHLPNGCLVVNPGSVGLPAYSDSLPVPHKMESGSPHARYASVERTSAGWTVSLHAVPYDWEEAANLAASNGFIDWIRPLRMGFV